MQSLWAGLGTLSHGSADFSASQQSKYLLCFSDGFCSPDWGFFFLQLYCSHLLSWRLRQAQPAKLQSQQRMQRKQNRDLTFKMMFWIYSYVILPPSGLSAKPVTTLVHRSQNAATSKTPCVTWKKILWKNSLCCLGGFSAHLVILLLKGLFGRFWTTITRWHLPS